MNEKKAILFDSNNKQLDSKFLKDANVNVGDEVFSFLCTCESCGNILNSLARI